MTHQKPKAEAAVERTKVERHDGEGLVLTLPGHPGGVLDLHFVPHSPVARIDYAVVRAGPAGEAAALVLLEEAKRISKSRRAVLRVGADVLPVPVLAASGFVSQTGEYVCDLLKKDV